MAFRDFDSFVQYLKHIQAARSYNGFDTLRGPKPAESESVYDILNEDAGNFGLDLDRFLRQCYEDPRTRKELNDAYDDSGGELEIRTFLEASLEGRFQKKCEFLRLENEIKKSKSR